MQRKGDEKEKSILTKEETMADNVGLRRADGGHPDVAPAAAGEAHDMTRLPPTQPPPLKRNEREGGNSVPRLVNGSFIHLTTILTQLQKTLQLQLKASVEKFVKKLVISQFTDKC